MAKLKFFILIFFVSGGCRANPILYFKISKNEVIPSKNELIITSKEVTVQIMVDEILPAQSHDLFTIDQLICYDNETNHTIFRNLNFARKYLTTQYRYTSTQELKYVGDNDPWQWLCILYAQDGRNVPQVYKFEVKVIVKMLGKDETNESTLKDTDEKIPLHEHQVPSKTKQIIKNGPSDLNEDVGAAKTNLESTGKIFSNKTLEISTEKQFTEPKSLSSGNTEQTSRDQKAKNQKPTENNDVTDLIMKPSNTLKNVNGSSSQVANGEISTLTNWVIFVLVSVVIFIVGLVIGAICRCPTTSAPAPEPTEPTDDQTDEHIYEEVEKGIQNRPPPPDPEKEVNIYNSPYDHTRWFQNQIALKLNASDKVEIKGNI